MKRFRTPAFILCLLVVLSLIAINRGSQGGPTTVQVTLSEFKIQSSVTTFVRGQNYHFVVKNVGHLNHEFMMMPKMDMKMSMEEMHKMDFADIDTVKPGETKTLDYAFPSSAASGPFELGCHYPGHYEAGMHKDVLLQ